MTRTEMTKALESDKSQAERNRMLSQVEVKAWIDTPPTKYFAYISEERKTLETWVGDKLGDVKFGVIYHTPAFGCFPSTRVSIRVKAINGEWYSGTYYKSAGSYARIKWTARKGW